MNPDQPTNVEPQQPVSQITQSTPIVPISAPFQKSKKRSWKKIVLIIVGVFLAICVSAYFFIINITAEQSRVSEDFITKIQANNTDDSYALLAPTLRKATPKDVFTSFVKKESKFLPKTKPSIVSRTVKSSSGVNYTEIVLDIKADKDSDSNYHATVQLVKVNDKWLVQYISIKAGLAPSSTAN